jgi:NhaP-type Na+/H+ or K+/H+ antiporter
VFEAALSIDKKSFNRHVVPILFYAIAGTLLATVITAFIVHRGTVALGGWCETIPYVESLTFGALISSIDPIAVLSVLSNMGMTDTDTIYVVIFGESLLNDGVAIVLFQTLVHFLDESLVIDSEALTAATIHFFVIALGSLSVGFVSGMICTVYYWAFHGCQTPLVEVLMFFCWAFIPYYVCDGVGWSGIVAVVTTGFVMDLYVVGQNMSDNSSSHDEQVISNVTHKRALPSFWKRAFSKQGHLSAVARTHVGFVTEILATMMETAIFAYLGYFLFSYRYHWNVWHTLIAIFACCVSRGIMIPSLSFVANWTTHLQQVRNNCRPQSVMRRNPPQSGVKIDPKMQLILWFAGLRGAMSFALVENIPLYDTVTGEGSRLKPEMKAMTSASIVFTVFVLGGYTFYMIERLGMAPNSTKQAQSLELVSLIPSLSMTTKDQNRSGEDEQDDDEDQASYDSSPRRDGMFRQRKSDILPSPSATNGAVDHAPKI